MVCSPRPGTGPSTGSWPADLDGRQQRVDLAARRADGPPAVAGAQLRMAGELLGGAQPGAGDPGRLERVADLVGGAARERLLDHGGQLVVVRDPVGVAREARVRSQVGPPHDEAAEGEPLALVLDTEKDSTVGDAERAVRRDRRMPCPGSSRRLAAVPGEIGGLHHQLAERVEHGDAQRRASAGPLPVVQRGQDAAVGVHPGREVGDGEAGLGRRLRGAGRHDQPGLALHQQVVGLLRAVRAAVAVAGDRAVDQPRQRRPERWPRPAPAARPHRGPGSARTRRPRSIIASSSARSAASLTSRTDALLAPVQPDEVAGLAVHGAVVAAREVAAARAARP